MRGYDEIVVENLFLTKELAEKERIINNYRAVFGEKDSEIIETTDKAILKNWYKGYVIKQVFSTQEIEEVKEVEEHKSWFSKLISAILDHLPSWLFVEE